jgi:rhodanese-related sulfurtransferase
MKTSISPEELKKLLVENAPLTIIDVRTREEYNQSHLPIAGNLGIDIIENGLFVPEPGKIVITVCGKGAGRSERAAAWLRIQNDTEAYFLEGGTIGFLIT